MSGHDDNTKGTPGGAREPDRKTIGSSVPRHLVDAFFDRELDPPARLELFALLRKDLRAATEMERTQEAIDALREEEPAPDLTMAILDEWESRRAAGFVPTPAQREAMRSSRLPWMNIVGMAAALALALGGILFLSVRHRAAPSTPTQPIAAVPAAPSGEPTPHPVSPAGRSNPAPPRVLALLRPGEISVQHLSQVRSGTFRVLSGAGTGSIFSWNDLASRDLFAARIARTNALLDGWSMPTASRDTTLACPAFVESSLVPSARTAPVMPEPNAMWR
jgi:hypothetical protein